MRRNTVIIILTFCAGSMACDGQVPATPMSPIPTSPAVPQSSPATLPSAPGTPGQADLTLPQATALAIQNHPQIAAAQQTAAAAGQRITEARAPYYPVVNGEITGSAGSSAKPPRGGCSFGVAALQPLRTGASGHATGNRLRKNEESGCAIAIPSSGCRTNHAGHRLRYRARSQSRIFWRPAGAGLRHGCQ